MLEETVKITQKGKDCLTAALYKSFNKLVEGEPVDDEVVSIVKDSKLLLSCCEKLFESSRVDRLIIALLIVLQHDYQDFLEYVDKIIAEVTSKYCSLDE